jgi:cytochrome c
MTKLSFVAAATAAAVMLAGTTAFAAGDAAKGAKVFNKCKACHDSAKGAKHKVGPTLFGIIGRKAGTIEGFNRYKGLVGADWTWDEALLKEYLKDPKDFTKKRTGKDSTMTFKLTKDDEIADVVAYVQTLK